jgi:hypothetical protein
MLQGKVLARDRPVITPWHYANYGKDVHRKEILRVLERAAEDNDFIAQLTYQGDEALRGYDLAWLERAALLSGDIRWIEARLGKLDERLRTWLDCRLQQEKW